MESRITGDMYQLPGLHFSNWCLQSCVRLPYASIPDILHMESTNVYQAKIRGLSSLPHWEPVSSVPQVEFTQRMWHEKH